MQRSQRKTFDRRHALRAKRGSVVTEFLLTFPAFLVLCMFTIEISCMWMDRHVVRLASFEAARRIAASEAPLEGDPCLLDENKRAGRSAAARRIAAISPSVTYLLKALDLGFDFSLPDLGNGKAIRAAKRLLLRLPSAAALTEVDCKYADGAVTVEVTYHRMPMMPIIDKIMYAAYKLTAFNAARRSRVGFDASFRGISRAEGDQVDDLRSDVIKALATAKQADLGDDETARLIGGIDGLEISTLSGFTHKSESLFNSAIIALPTQVLESAGSKLSTQEALLAAAMFATGLRLIPMTVETTVQRRTYGVRTKGPSDPEDEVWQGVLKGVARLGVDDSIRAWGHEMSQHDRYLSGGKDL